MTIKERVKRVSKIFSNDSKESLDKQIAAAGAKPPAETEEAATTEATTADDTAAADASAGETAPADVVEEGEPVALDVDGIDTPAVKADADADTAVEAAEADAEPNADADATNAPEVAEEAEGETAPVEKANKKHDFFKKLFSKFKKPVVAKA
ncbi:hypothetical protein KGF56_004102 [Candida oxycetoniae]|uniref:Uncharacterized protein n=1 Tax=Candida oxycetoniae TaxID=497107 RepID=A0AAI9SU08_9ASCO|nr:uncharacterized protein KGF56_004102 [Candida oxycetoniae]KAI3403042.1 hypothetical protein KGF56_004102 [Candida oxycetoniae]